jgi:hypothetical protein
MQRRLSGLFPSVRIVVDSRVPSTFKIEKVTNPARLGTNRARTRNARDESGKSRDESAAKASPAQPRERAPQDVRALGNERGRDLDGHGPNGGDWIRTSAPEQRRHS